MKYQKASGRFLSLAFSHAGKSTGIVFISNVTAAGLGFVATLFATRVLGPQDYGLLAASLAIMTTIVGLTDFGLGTTGIRFASEYLHTNVPKAHAVLRVVFRLEVVIGLIILIAGIGLTPYVNRILSTGSLGTTTYLAFVGAAALSAGAFYNIALQAYQKFSLYSIMGIINGVFRLAILFFLYYTERFSVPNVLAAYALSPILGLALGYSFIPRDYLRSKDDKLDQEIVPEMVRFGKWTMVSFIVMSIVGRLDVLTLQKYYPGTQVGLYGAAVQLITALPLLIGSITAVLLPKSGSIRTIVEMRSFVKKSLLGSATIFLLLLPVVAFSGTLIHLIFGNKYIDSIPLFQILFWGYMLSLFINPLSIVLLRLNKPHISAYANILQCLIGVIGYSLMVPPFGVYGAAWVNFTIGIIGGLVVIPSIVLALKREGEVTP